MLSLYVMVIIFDIDGTLLGGEVHDWASFDRALNTVLGFAPSPAFFSALHDVTAESIADAAIRASGRKPTQDLVTEIRESYLRHLGEVHTSDPGAFPVKSGVRSLLNHLTSTPGTGVAVATGDWLPTIAFKLQCAGLDLSRFPMASASEARRRPDIIKLAAAKAGRSVTEAVYVGDGVWDLHACRELGIPFIGTGNRTARLIQAGAEAICEDLGIGLFTRLLHALRVPPNHQNHLPSGRAADR